MPKRTPHRFMFCIIFLLIFPLSASSQYDSIKNRNQVISIEYQASLKKSEREVVYRWLKEVTGTLLTVYGQLPRDNFRITIKRSSSRTSPVPWGNIERGGLTNVVLFVNPDFGYDKLIKDWTAFHEFSHLLIPYRGYGDVWLSEGIATYYQNIIRVRSGLLNETAMWNRIVAGFERGNNEQQWRHVSLSKVSDNLGETRQFMRVHWSGVLFWLTADVELRKQGNNTLDTALMKLRNCCEQRLMSAEEIVRKLDDLTSENVFVPLFNKFTASNALPDFKSIVIELGVEQKKQADRVSLNEIAPLSRIRQQISGQQ